MIVIFFIILLSGFGLYVLLKPPAKRFEQPAGDDELFAEIMVSNVASPEHSTRSEQTVTTNSDKKE